MQRLDLRRNAFSHDAVKKLQTHCHNIQGVTSVIWTKEQTLAIHSGNQLRQKKPAQGAAGGNKAAGKPAIVMEERHADPK